MHAAILQQRYGAILGHIMLSTHEISWHVTVDFLLHLGHPHSQLLLLEGGLVLCVIAIGSIQNADGL